MKLKPGTNKSIRNIKYNSPHELNKAHTDDSGYDIKASVSSPVQLKPGQHKAIDTGLFMELPKSLEAQVRPRSGLALKHGITVLNSPGTIDSGYRGEIKVILINHGKEVYTVRNGDKIAQLVFSQILDTAMIRTNTAEYEKTERDISGFGSTDDKYTDEKEWSG